MPLSSSISSKLNGAIRIAFAILFVTSFFTLDAVHGFSKSAKPGVIDSPLLTQKIGANRSIMVDVNGNGDFKSIQDAINSVPEGNSGWIIIHVTKGIYREKVYIPENKPYIFMRGNGNSKTSIVWSQSSHDNLESATFRVEAPHFVAFGIRFKNDAPTGEAFTPQNQSVAAVVAADKAAFYHCSFSSTHNTLFDYKGRHYYDSCYIQGSVDCIFGRGQSIFHNYYIFVITDRRLKIHGSITAHQRGSAKEKSGFVFIKGRAFGISDVHLGKAKGAYSRVIFANSYLSQGIVPQGWTTSGYSGSTENLYQAEYDNHGPGSNTTSRAPWSKQLNEKEAAPYLSIDFIDGKEWLPAWL
ncbi:probable pectinesterase 67 [Rhododendron vialii]|uniref:probable pectinesterase 67 n=1 Tax=Rhododendron vialii TaxID=182163 RepID=UPI00266004FA|nr:probable pectinesterase 67 [Rhododendron vialii]